MIFFITLMIAEIYMHRVMIYTDIALSIKIAYNAGYVELNNNDIEYVTTAISKSKLDSVVLGCGIIIGVITHLIYDADIVYSFTLVYLISIWVRRFILRMRIT